MTAPRFTRIDHVGIACADLASSLERWTTVSGAQLLGQEDNDEQGVREAMLAVSPAPGGASCVQLLEPLRPDSPVGRFLDRRGEGLHHVAFGVDDIEAAMAELRDAGVRLLDERPRHGFGGSRIAFAHPQDMSGVLTELVEAPRPAS